MADAKKLRAELDRPVTQHEADIIRWLLEHGDPKYLTLASQIDALRVVSKCTCGCPTVDFDLGDGINSHKGEGMFSDCGAEVEGEEVGVLLFQVHGRISSLEVYSCAGSDRPFGLPSIESLYLYHKVEQNWNGHPVTFLNKPSKG